MPRKTKPAPADQAALPQIPAELLDKLIPGPVTPGQLEDVCQKFKKAFIQQALGAEMSDHLGYAPGQAKPQGAANHRNGKSAKTVLTDTGSLAIKVPRDRAGSFEPQLIGKHESQCSTHYAIREKRNLEKDLLPHFAARRIGEIEPIELLAALRPGRTTRRARRGAPGADYHACCLALCGGDGTGTTRLTLTRVIAKPMTSNEHLLSTSLQCEEPHTKARVESLAWRLQ